MFAQAVLFHLTCFKLTSNPDKMRTDEGTGRGQRLCMKRVRLRYFISSWILMKNFMIKQFFYILGLIQGLVYLVDLLNMLNHVNLVELDLDLFYFMSLQPMNEK